MCGILFSADIQMDRVKFQRALGLMNHRGPDSDGVALDVCGRFNLGHKRLKILDLDARSDQPFWSADGRFVITYNGEIYNYRELAKKHGLRLRTTSDTELLVELYARHGSKMLPELNGMYAFVIVDVVAATYFAARDRLGVKPLYTATVGPGIIFSSEVAPILELTGRRDLDPFGVRQYRKLRTTFNGHTLYAGIEVFPAGHHESERKRTRFWSLPHGPKQPPDDEELAELVRSSVQYRCIADVQVGSYLSGGLDSTIVATLSRTPDTWTVGSRRNNEFVWASLAARDIGSDHHEVVLEEGEYLDLAKQMIRKRREPLSVPNEVLIYKMTQAVKTKNTVILSGEGADELFFGYDRIFRWAAEADAFDLKAFDRLYSYGSHEDDEVLEDALSPFVSLGDAINIVAAFFQIAHLHGLLRRLDNATMLCGVEARVPFVDYRLVERMAGVPFSYRMERGIVKAPLKRVFRNVVPEKVIARDKVGFPVDLKAIFRDTERSPMDAWLEFNLHCLAEE